jgi:hypothetical protein
MFFLRGGYDYQKGIINKSEATTVNLGPSAGLGFQIPFKRNKTGELVQEDNSDDLHEGAVKSRVFGFDYSYSATRYFGGTHRFSLTLSL